MKYVIPLMLLCACSSVKKSSSKAKASVDSVASSSAEAGTVKRSDSTGNAQEKGGYVRETVYHYDTVKLPGEIRYVPRIITIREAGNYEKQQQASTAKVDSTGQQSAQTVEVKKDTVVKEQGKSKKGIPWQLWALFAVMALVGVFAWGIKKQL